MAFHNFPYTDFHEFNLDYLLSELQRLKDIALMHLTNEVKEYVTEATSEQLDELTADITERLDETDENVDAIEKWRDNNEGGQKTQKRVYVDSVNGEDNLERSGSSAEPFKTLDFVFENFGQRRDLYIMLADGGSYVLNYTLYAGDELHMSSYHTESGSVTDAGQVTVSVPNQLRWYNKYLHFERINFVFVTGHFQAENSYLRLYSCNVTSPDDTTISVLGGALTLGKSDYGYAEGCTINGCVAAWQGAFVYIPSHSHSIIANTTGKIDEITAALDLRFGSTAHISGGVVRNTGDGYSIRCRGSKLVLEIAESTTSTRYFEQEGNVGLLMGDCTVASDAYTYFYNNCFARNHSHNYTLNGTFTS